MIIYRTKKRTFTMTIHDHIFYEKICNELHSPDNDTPAEEHSLGSKSWYKDGKLHRENDLPAFIGCTGIESYYQYGVLHRESGPAIIHPSGTNEFYLNDKYYGTNVNEWLKNHPNKDITFQTQMRLKYQ